MVLTRSTEKKEAQKIVENQDEEEEGEEEMDEETDDDGVPDVITAMNADTFANTSLLRSSAVATTAGRRGGISGLPAGLSSAGATTTKPTLSSSGKPTLKSGLTLGRAGLTVAPKISSPVREGGAGTLTSSLPGLNNRPNTRLRSGISMTAPAELKPPEEAEADESDFEDDSAEESGGEGKAATKSQAAVGRLLSAGLTFAAAQSGRYSKKAESSAADKDARGLLAGLSVSDGKGAKLDKGARIQKSENKGEAESGEPSPRLALSRLPPGMQVSKSRALPETREDTIVREGGEKKKEEVGQQLSLKIADQRKSISRLPPGLQLSKQKVQLPSEKEDQERNESESDQSGNESESVDEGDESAEERWGESGKESQAGPVKPASVTSTREERFEDSEDEEDDEVEDDLNEDGDDPNKEKDEQVGLAKPGVGLSRLPPGMQITTRPASPLLVGDKVEEGKETAVKEPDMKEVGIGRSSRGLTMSKSRLPPGMQLSKSVSSPVKDVAAQVESEEELDSNEEESEIDKEDDFGSGRSGTKPQVPKAISAVPRLPPGLQVGKSSNSKKESEEGSDAAEMDDVDPEESDQRELEEEEDEDGGGKSDEVNESKDLKGSFQLGLKVKQSGLVIKSSPLSGNAPVEKSSDDEFEDIVEDEDSEEPAAANDAKQRKSDEDEKGEGTNAKNEKLMRTSEPESQTAASQRQPLAVESQHLSRTSFLAPLLPLRSKQGLSRKQKQHLTSELQQLSSRLREADLLEKVTKALGHDAVLVLSGEEECTDAETKSFFCALTNIVEEESLAQFLEMDSLEPLSNFALRVALFVHLQKLVYKEPNLKELVVKEVGLDDLKEFDSVTSFYAERGDEFVRENVVRCTWLYHRVRNLSLHYVLKKLELVYTKMKPVLSRPSSDSGYISSVALLSRLMAGSWREQVLLSEERNYDFDFLITILMYWKKEKSHPGSGEKVETSVPNLMQKKITPMGEGQLATALAKPAAAGNPGLAISDRPPPSNVPRGVLPAGLSTAQQEKPAVGSVQDRSHVIAVQDRSPVAVTAIHAQTKAGVQRPPIVGSLSVLSLHQVRDMLDRDEGAQKRVLGGVGQQAFSEFRNLVTKLTDTSVQIQDVNVRTLYYTILNFAKHPVTATMRQYEPLSNFSLRVEPFLDLRRLLEKDANIQDVVRRQLGGTEVERFLVRTATLEKEKKDFVVEKQEENILLYHKLRNCIIDNLMSRLGKVHAKIKMVTLRNPPATFNIAVAMLESLMATHYNGQVLMMEKSKFDFDFLSTILSFLQQTNQGGQQLGDSRSSVSNDELVAAAVAVKSDLKSLPILAGVKQVLGQEDFERQLKIVSGVEQGPGTRGLDLVQKRAIHGLKNALFMCKNNIHCSDTPLSNISLEVSKFSTLVKFISKDVGIKTAISLKFGEVALKELEALVMAHEERDDEFVTKFVDKNTSLYHGLRNTALEKILRQMGVVHGKVRHISLSSNARTPEYQVAIKALDSIVYADLSQKIRLIEEMKFEFDFLSTILMVWKTETSRQAEETKKLEERRRAEQERARLTARQDARRREMEEMPVEILEESVDDPSPFNQLALPSPNMVGMQQTAQRSPFNNRRPFLSPRSSAFSSTTRPPLALPPPPRIATAADPMPVDPKAASELPIRTKCNLCPDKTSENVEQLIQHYSFMHFREPIEKAYVANWGECGKCGEKFTLKFNLIKHIGLVHRAVLMEITPTERWICKECHKEFLSDDFLKKHWIKAHLEREFETRFFVVNESEELLCQFCEKTFSHKKNLFVHVGLDHDKLVELKPEYNTKDPKEKLLKCKNCDFAGDEDGLKAHLATTHYRQSLLALCLEEQALRPSSLNCTYCDYVSESQELLVEHLGTEHSKVLRYVSHFQGKNVKMVFNTKLEGFKAATVGALDPLAQDPLADPEEDLASNKQQEMSSRKSVGVTTIKSRAARKPMDNKALVSEIGSKTKAHTVVSSESLWVGRLKKFAEQQEGSLQMMLDGDFQDVASKVVGRFLETLISEADVEDAVAGLSKFCPGLKASRAVVREKLARNFRAHCAGLAVAPSNLPAMQTVILLSQLLGKPGASPADLQPVLEAVGRLAASHGEPLIVEFFKSIGHPLLRVEREEDKNMKNVSNQEEKKDGRGEEAAVPVKKEGGKEKLGITVASIPVSRVKLPNIQPSSPRVSSEQAPPTRASPEQGVPPRISSEQAAPPAGISSKLPLTEKPTAPDNQATELVEVKREPVLVAMERRQDLESGLDPECITLEEEEGEKEEKDYRFLCLDCEGERGCKGAACLHTTHPRIPLEFDLSAHIVSTGHVDIRPLPQHFSIQPVMDVAYSLRLGAEVRKQWKELVLAGSHVPSQFTGVRRCKWAKCRQPFEDAVEAFKHIRDTHLKPLQTLKQLEVFPGNLLQEASVNVSSSSLEIKQTTESTGKRVGESLVTVGKKMRVGN